MSLNGNFLTSKLQKTNVEYFTLIDTAVNWKLSPKQFDVLLSNSLALISYKYYILKPTVDSSKFKVSFSIILQLE